jgi:glycerol uptake facilitator protein
MKEAKETTLMPESFLGELLGTMMLVLLGDGVVAAVLLNKSKAQGAGWIVITAGWAFAVMCGIFVSAAFGSPGADLNPAVTIAVMVRGGYSVTVGLLHMVAQMIGAFIGAVLVWLAYLPHWAETEDPGTKLGVFSTGPAIRNPTTNLIAEIIGTFVLVFVIFSIFSATGATSGDPAPGVGPYLVAALVWGIGLSLGGPTGYAINPARDLGPRIAHFVLPIAGKGDSDWSYSWIPVVGPLVGGALAAVLFMAFGGS